MENNFEQYGTLLDSVSEAAEACLDMEGGAFFLAWAGELIQDLVAEGYCQSACLTAQKLCKAVGADRTWTDCNELEPMEKQAWLNLFIETLKTYHKICRERLAFLSTVFLLHTEITCGQL